MVEHKEDKEGSGMEPHKFERSRSNPLVFISHDTRDAKFAEAFSTLLESISAGMIKTFRSSDKSGKEGIQYGDEWYSYLMDKLKVTTHVVCLFTKSSLERPWILYEAGVAKSSIDTKVMGLALGVPMKEVGTGPFYHFQNVDSTKEELTGLIQQLASEHNQIQPHPSVVSSQVDEFLKEVEKLLGERGSSLDDQDTDENSIARLAEEMKILPSRIAERLEIGEINRKRRRRRFHPRMLDEMMSMFGHGGDPIGILMAASFVKDDMPWFYEIAKEAYRAVKGGSVQDIERELQRVKRFAESKSMIMFADEFGFREKDSHFLIQELPFMLSRTLELTLAEKMTRKRVLKQPKLSVKPEELNAAYVDTYGAEYTQGIAYNQAADDDEEVERVEEV